MEEFGVKAAIACSWVEMRGRVYRFTVNDCSSPISRTYDFLQYLMKKSGFVADTSNAACNVDEEHKLPSSTLAFALIRVGDEKIIRIRKNFRVCGGCHELFKFVSSAYEREIALDPNQYHRFTQGSCSCHDFW
ncbi:Pentatricopeptide repeat-containing protein [Platanthera guangdongensis]|uniref:Pentatricopeptide repeat-containing protein n=1 Tax=Platanthera guangdongensis TaxID=2320717 RepID=A0ABR2M7C6_9ASPA